MKFPKYDKVHRVAGTVHHTYLSTCEIADAKARLGFQVKRAWNRRTRRRTRICPDYKLKIIDMIIHDLNRRK